MHNRFAGNVAKMRITGLFFSNPAMFRPWKVVDLLDEGTRSGKKCMSGGNPGGLGDLRWLEQLF